MNYPRLTNYGISANHTPTTHVKMNDLRAKLPPAVFALVQDALYGQTCTIVDGIGEPYPWDVEDALRSAETGWVNQSWD